MGAGLHHPLPQPGPVTCTPTSVTRRPPGPWEMQFVKKGLGRTYTTFIYYLFIYSLLLFFDLTEFM